MFARIKRLSKSVPLMSFFSTSVGDKNVSRMIACFFSAMSRMPIAVIALCALACSRTLFTGYSTYLSARPEHRESVEATYDVTHTRHQELQQRAHSKVEREDRPNGLIEFIWMIIRRMQRVDIVVEPCSLV